MHVFESNSGFYINTVSIKASVHREMHADCSHQDLCHFVMSQFKTEVVSTHPESQKKEKKNVLREHLVNEKRKKKKKSIRKDE